MADKYDVPDQVKDLPEVPGTLAEQAAPALGPVAETPDDIYKGKQ